jgi:SMC interacting uncharacterized protein involved in chromosome segregation
MRSNLGNDRHFRVIALDELRTLLEPPKPKRQKRGKAVTKIGKAIEANEKQIVLAIEALQIQIRDKLTTLKGDLPNSPEAIAKKNASVSEFEQMKAELERIKVAIQQFKKAEIKEKEVIQTIHTFKDSLGKWWNKNHDTIYSSASNSALFLGAIGLLHTINADSATALAIAGSLIGGETVAKVLKSLPRGLFNKHRD